MGPKRADVIAAALVFVRSRNPQDQMFVVNFNERVSFGLPVSTPFTDQVAHRRDTRGWVVGTYWFVAANLPLMVLPRPLFRRREQFPLLADVG